MRFDGILNKASPNYQTKRISLKIFATNCKGNAAVDSLIRKIKYMINYCQNLNATQLKNGFQCTAIIG